MDKEFKKNRAVATWLIVGAVMIIIQVLLGGITRLTDSGLSITEWKPILGALPPMNEHQWQEAFEKYKQIAQYKYIHNYFTLHDFKSIYFWEWLHRNWGRFMGIVFAVPFIYFLYKKKFDRSMLWPMISLFIMGGITGALGWIMVSSGVGTALVFVDHLKLAVHLMSAVILFCLVVWFALKISYKNDTIVNHSLKSFNLFLLIIVAVQLIYGAFMAGLHAAKAAITWPDMNGQYFPALFTDEAGSFWYNITSNPVTVQFIHRGLAYCIFLLIVFFTIQLFKQPKNSHLYKLRWLPMLLVVMQVALGIITLVTYLNRSDKILFGVLHQMVGLLFTGSLIVTLYFTGKRSSTA
ncbi:MAG: COX15/CtaA family protein [Niabella sp.]